MIRPRWASIIITSYNYGRFLKQTIGSAIDQTYPNVEVIVVDDGSTDDSLKIISSYNGEIIPILKDHEGPIAALKTGFEASRGELVIFLDSDDALLPTAVEKAMASLADLHVVKAHWQLWEIDVNGEKTGRLIPSETLSDGVFLQTVIREGPDSCAGAPMSGNAWSRTFLEKVFPLLDLHQLNVDTYFTTAAAVLGAIRKISEPQGYYRLHGSNEFGSKSSDERNKRNLATYEDRCLLLSKFLAETGTKVDPDKWKRGNVHWTWMNQQDLACEEIKRLVPAGESFILVDEDNLGDRWGGSEVVAGRRAIPFTERAGKYWGPPEDDRTGIKEVERLRQSGASFIIFAWPAFWWLDYYSQLHSHLRSKAKCISENDQVIVFDLRPCDRNVRSDSVLGK